MFLAICEVNGLPLIGEQALVDRFLERQLDLVPVDLGDLLWLDAEIVECLALR